MATPHRCISCAPFTDDALRNRRRVYTPGRKVDAIDAAPNDFTVHSGTERFTAPRVVIAAGLGSRDLAPMVGLAMPVTPLQGQIIVTERLPHFLDYATHVHAPDR